MEIIKRAEARVLGLKTYFTGVPCANGHLEMRSVANGICYQCRRDSQNKYRASNLEKDRKKSRNWYADNKQKAAEWKRNWIAQNPEKYVERRKKYRNKTESRAREMLTAAKHRAANKGVEFSIDYEWLVERLAPMRCELTGIELKMTDDEYVGKQSPFAPSIDRINSSKGYSKENCRVVCWGINCGMSSYGEEIYMQIAAAYLKRTGLT